MTPQIEEMFYNVMWCDVIDFYWEFEGDRIENEGFINEFMRHKFYESLNSSNLETGQHQVSYFWYVM